MCDVYLRIAVEESKQWKSILICTIWLAGYESVTLTHKTQKWTFIVLFPEGYVFDESKVHFCVLEVSLIDSYPTKQMVQIKMDFHYFDSSTVTCVYTFCVCVYIYIHTHSIYVSIYVCICTRTWTDKHSHVCTHAHTHRTLTLILTVCDLSTL